MEPPPTSPRRRLRRDRPWSWSRCRRNNTSWLFVLAALAVASSSCWMDQQLVVLASDNNSSTEDDNETLEPKRKPYRQTYGGRIKLVPTRKLIRITTVEEENTTPWRKDKRRGRGDKGDADAKSLPRLSPAVPPTLWTRLSPFLKRGFLLAFLTAVAIVDRRPPPSTALAASAGTAMSRSKVVASWTERLVPYRLDWNKFWSLPGEILPSLSAALMIAWLPNLVMQKAWWELGFLVLSLSSQESLRNYLFTEVLPSLGGTVRKLFWSEFWKQAWDYLLEPFPQNMLVPTKPSSSSEINEGRSQWQVEISQFWSDRVVSRIDKWTASSVKALLQKNVQASVNGLAEDSWKAVAYSWYPDGENRDLKRPKLPSPSNEDTARMIELECEGEDKENCLDDTKTSTTISMSDSGDDDNSDNKVEEESSVASSDSGDDTESRVSDGSSEDSSRSSTGEEREVSSSEESEIEEPQAVLSN